MDFVGRNFEILWYAIEIYNVRHCNVGSYLFNKYIETIHVSNIYVDDCLLHIYNKDVVTTSKVKGLFTVLFEKPVLHNQNSQQLTYINNDISYLLGINIFEEVYYTIVIKLVIMFTMVVI